MKKLGLGLLLLIATMPVLVRGTDAQTGWSYLRTITVHHDQVVGTGDLTDFPMLVHITMDTGQTWLKDVDHGGHVARPDGGDIFFTLSDYTLLDHEIETYDGLAGTLVAWVRIPTLSTTSDTLIYMFYGNPAARAQSTPATVWDAHYTMVQHLQETSGTHYDSTPNDNDCTPQGGVIQDAVGQIDGADDLDGGDDALNCGIGEKQWSNQDQGQQRAVIKDGKIYVVGGGDDDVNPFDAYAYIFDLATGQILQQSPSLGQYDFTASETAPVVDGDVVYATPTQSNIYAWDTTSNSIAWTTTGLSIWSNRLEFDGDFLYATTTDYHVVKVDVSDGTVVDSFALDPDSGYQNAVPPYLDQSNDTLFAMGASQLYKLSASTLSEDWHRTIGTACLDDSTSSHSRMAPIVVDDAHTGNQPWVIAGCREPDAFFAFDYDGTLKWTVPIPEGVRAVASYNPNNGFLYIPSQGDRIYALDVATGDFQFDVTGGDVPAGSGFDRPCTISNNYLIFKTTSGSPSYLYVFDATTGDYITQFTLGSNLFLTCFPIAVSQGYLVTGGSLINYGSSELDGGIFAVKAGTGLPVDYYPLYGPQKFGYVENALTSLQTNTLTPPDQITLEAWANLDALTTGTNDHLLCRASTYCLKFAQEDAGDAPRFQLWDTTGTRYDLDLSAPLSTAHWHYLAGTWDGTTMRFYVDGTLQGSRPFAASLPSTSLPTFIGSYSGATSQAPDGRIDEARISNAARSAGWIATSYQNQVDPSSFYTTGPEQQPGLDVAKTPATQTVPYGSAADFTITVSNTGTVDFSRVQVADPLAPACNRTLPALPAGAATSYSCTMPGVLLDTTNPLTATAHLSTIPILTATASAFVDVLPTLQLDKTAQPTTLPEPGGTITFTVTLTNTSPEPVTLTALSDSIHGDLDGLGSCSLPRTLAPQATYRCSFAATVSGQAGYVETDQVTATAHDDDLNPVHASDRATVTLTPLPAVLVMPQTLTIAEPHGSAPFVLTLSTQPNAPVSIGLSTANGQCSVAPSSVLLNTTNWATGASVTVTAVDDTISDGDQPCIVLTAPSTSLDPNYQNIDPPDVTVTVQDNDTRCYLPLITHYWPLAPVLQPIHNPDGIGSYTLVWTAIPPAETYLIQQAHDPAFDDATEIDAGSSLSYQVSGRGPGRYYYRVMARTNWGDTNWSTIEYTDVLWELEPNDEALTQANGPLVCGQTYLGTFPSMADLNDYFYFDLASPCSVDLALTNIPPTQNYDLVLRDDSLALLAYSGQLGNADDHIHRSSLAAGRYIIQVFHRDGDGSAQAYHLRFACSCAQP